MNENKEPVRYAYMIDGELTAGTLDDYAQVWVASHYSGVYVSSTVMTWSATHHTVQVSSGHKDEDDYIHYQLRANGETAFASIDGRS